MFELFSFQYSLAKDVVSSLKRPNMYASQFRYHPLLVLNNFSKEEPHLKLTATVLQNMFPSINVHRVRKSVTEGYTLKLVIPQFIPDLCICLKTVTLSELKIHVHFNHYPSMYFQSFWKSCGGECLFWISLDCTCCLYILLLSILSHSLVNLQFFRVDPRMYDLSYRYYLFASAGSAKQDPSLCAFQLWSRHQADRVQTLVSRYVQITGGGWGVEPGGHCFPPLLAAIGADERERKMKKVRFILLLRVNLPGRHGQWLLTIIIMNVKSHNRNFSSCLAEVPSSLCQSESAAVSRSCWRPRCQTWGDTKMSATSSSSENWWQLYLSFSDFFVCPKKWCNLKTQST